MIKIAFNFTAIASVLAAFYYLDWSFLQLIGVTFVLFAADTAVEKKPAWVRVIAVTISFLLMVLAHFVVDDVFLHWGTLLLSAMLFFVAFSAIFAIKNSGPGTGSVLTAYFLGFLITLPLAIYTLNSALKNFGFI